MMIHRFIALMFALALPVLAQAQDTPPRPSQPVTDLADLLPPEAEARLTEQITTLRSDTGIELLVVTMESRTPYAPAPTMEAFVTNLFNAWGIGDATRNDGILIYVARSDREMRIELGAGYGTDWNHYAREVIESNFLPYFRDDRYSDGIEAGTRATIRDIARPYAAGVAAPSPKSGGVNLWLIGLFGLSGLFLNYRRSVSDFGVRLRKCPNCGGRSLRRSRKVVYQPSRSHEGHGDATTQCRQCDYHDITPYRLRRLSSRQSSSSGGGRSSGGGASGRW